MKPRVYIAKPIPAEVEAYIAEYCEYEKWEGEGTAPRSLLLEKISNVDGLLISGGKIDKELLENAPRLKVVSNISVGYNNFRIEAMRERGIIGTNTPYVLDDTVADLVLALMLSAARRIPELDHLVRKGGWTAGSDESYFGLDVHHKTVGIIGMGRIGEAIAKRAKFGFDMNVLYHNRRPKPDVEQRLGIEYAVFDDLLGKSDFVVLMTPLTADTRRMMGSEQFAKMKKTAIFINASRGPTVDEHALYEALQNRTIYAAGLDVFEQEPVNPENPLLTLPNVVVLPHIGSATEKTRFDMAMTAAKNLVAAVTGGNPENIVEELRAVE